MSAEEKKGIKISPLGMVFVVVYLLVAVGVALLGYSPDDEFMVSRLAGEVIGVSIVAAFISSISWLIFKRSSSAASIALCVIMFFGMTRSVGTYLVHQRGVKNQAVAQMEESISRLEKDQIAMLENVVKNGEDSSGQAVELLDKAAKSMEQIAQSTSGKDSDFVTITAGLLRTMQELMGNYNESFTAFQDHGGFDVSTLSSQDNITVRKQLLGDFMQANEDFDQLFANIDQIITKRVLAAGYTKRDARQYIIGARKGGDWESNRAIRDCDRRAGSAYDKILDLLNDNWAFVEYDATEQSLLINDDNLLAKCQEQFSLMEQAGAEQLELQTQILNKQKRQLQQQK